MPEYSYKCEKGHTFSVVIPYSSSVHRVSCPTCRSNQITKVIKPVQIIFRGSGFYINDKKGK